MPVSFDDWAVFDRSEAVTFTDVAPDGTTTDYAGVSAIPFQVTQVPVLGEVVGTLKQRVWHLRRSTLPGVIPGLGDRITQADGTVWVVLYDVADQTDSVRWRLTTQRLQGSGGNP